MKSLKTIILATAAAFGLTACNDYLDIMPENALPQEEMWASKGDVESALFAGYYNLRSSITTHLIPLGELRAGCVKRRSGNNLDKLDVKPNDKTYTDWKIFYKVIADANGVIANALALAKLVAVRVGDQRHGKGVHLVTGGLADQLDAGGDVAPLVRAGDLEVDASMLVQVLEVQTLDEHIRKLCVGDSALHLATDEILAEHIADIDIFSVVAEEFHDVDVLDPVVVVDHLVGEDLCQLTLEALKVVQDLVSVRELAFDGAAGVADESGGDADEEQGVVTCVGEAAGDEEGGVVTEVQAVCGGVGADVEGESSGVELVDQLRAGDVLDEASPFQFLVKCHGYRSPVRKFGSLLP